MANQSCKKDTNDPEEGGAKKQLTDLVPEEYLGMLKDEGMRIHEGNNPPNIEGSYLLGPLRFDYDSDGVPPGVYPQPGEVTNGDIRIQFSEQGAGKPDIKMTVESQNQFMVVNDWFVIRSPFVVGSGNDFTVCFELNQYEPVNAIFSITYAYLVSGTKEGGVLKNVQLAKICIKDEYMGQSSGYIGYAEIYSDADGVSEQVP